MTAPADPVYQEPDGAPGLQVYIPRSVVPPPTAPASTTNESDYASSYDPADQWGWYDAPVPPAGGVLVNVGLAMELWSGGAYKATMHRVVFPKSTGGVKERYTLAYFVQPDDEVVSFQQGDAKADDPACEG